MSSGGRFSPSRYAHTGFGSLRLRLSGICLRTGCGGVGRCAEVVTGLGAESECAMEDDRRGTTGASPSWCTSSDISMVGDCRVVLGFIHDRVLMQVQCNRAKRLARRTPLVCQVFVSHSQRTFTRREHCSVLRTVMYDSRYVKWLLHPLVSAASCSLKPTTCTKSSSQIASRVMF